MNDPQSTDGPRIVVIGGGTGSFVLLSSLKKVTSNITALVTMSDDGGSTGVLRDELGVLPPGDIRQCLVALSEAPEELRELFNFRFPKGTFEGHSFGNIFLSAVEKMTDDFNESIRIAGDVLHITGRVMPITLDDHKLVLEQHGEKVVGEFRVAQTKLEALPVLSLEPEATLNLAARQAIEEAQLIVIAPGNLYGSLAPALLVTGLNEALKRSSAKLAYVANLVNKVNQTPDFMVHDYANEIERFIGVGRLDYVLYNSDIPDDDLLQRYAFENEYPVLFDLDTLNQATYEAIPGNFLSRARHMHNPNETRILRSLIRHDGRAIGKALKQLVQNP